MLPKEDCVVVVTSDGYVKRVSMRSFTSNDEETTVKDGDFVTGIYKVNTLDTILLFTDKGNYLYVPVHEIPDLKWKELGKHISNIIKIDPGENIIYSLPIYDFDKDEYITMVSKNGMIKRTKLDEFRVLRYSKPLTCMKLKEDDMLVSVSNSSKSEIFITTHLGYGLRFLINEVAPTGIKSAGIKAINIKDDYVVSANMFDENDEYISVITSKSTGKRVRLSEFETMNRARKGTLIIRDVKTNPYYILKAFILNHKDSLVLKIGGDYKEIKVTELPIMDRYSTGSSLSKANIKNVLECAKVIDKEQNKKEELLEQSKSEVVEDISLEHVDEKIMTIDDFLDDFKVE